MKHYFFYSEKQENAMRHNHKYATFINGKQYTEWSHTNPSDSEWDDMRLVEEIEGTNEDCDKLITYQKYS